MQLGMESRIPRTKDGHIRVSQSDLSLFKADRREWLLGSYLGLRPKNQPVYGPLRLGTRVHSALERYYGMGHDLVESYLEIAEEELEGIRESGVVFDEKSWRDEADLGRIMLTGYVEWLEETAADSNLKVLGAEEKLSHTFEINGTPIELRGKIDLRARDTFTGQNLVVDWKTTSSIPFMTRMAPRSEQLLTYMTLERLNGQSDPDFALQGARFVLLRKTKRTTNAKPPFYTHVDVHHNEIRLRNFYNQLWGTLADYMRVVDALDRGIDHRVVAYPNGNASNRWSIFTDVNQMMDDGSRVEDMIADLYVQSDPHERYEDKAAELLEHVEEPVTW
ncbi:exonuclease [Gordonia phage Phendrix]|uniref:Exonuclease n=1 Tax=Gordonia phage Phendrix TaxID=2593335 RepID=A0A514U190_9CAUD|nr:exonuclease [Gordonia phage Phendrix]QDK02686.1 exonuclease [Gordonia phage Phendrix]